MYKKNHFITDSCYIGREHYYTTKEQKDILKLIEHETIPSVREAWIDYFLEKTKPSKYKKSD